MKITVLVASGIASIFLMIAPAFESSESPHPGIDPKLMTDDIDAEPVEIPTPGHVREVTAYNVGVREQTSDAPCVGAAGINLCRLVARGLKICAANFVALETILHIEGYGECIVLDRMHRRFVDRVDIAMKRNEVDRAIEFGVQRRYVRVKSVRP
jgi:3D (Asp-Asp-Asp) domain-containing protein